MTDDPVQPPKTPTLRRLVVAGLARALATATVLVAVYFLVPLGPLAKLPGSIRLTGALALLGTVAAWQVRAVMVSPNPAVRAIEGLAATVPLFVLLFAASYYLMAQADPACFNVTGLTRVDALYFAMTIFSTVGFGDIVATSQASRILVTVQMTLDLIALGLGARAFVGAVHLGRQRRDEDRRSGTPESG